MSTPWGSGSLNLRHGFWSLRKRVLRKGKVVQTRVRIGSIDDLPTQQDAEKAVIAYERVQADSLLSLRREGRLKAQGNLPVFSKTWFSRKMIEQGGRCAICGRIPKRLVVDHDHTDESLRGLLCSVCNTGIGMLQDDVVILRKALAYLEQYDVPAAAIAPTVPTETTDEIQ